MSDFHQQGAIADLPRLHETLDSELLQKKSFVPFSAGNTPRAQPHFIGFFEADAAIVCFFYDRSHEKSTVRCFQEFLQNGWGKDTGTSQTAPLPSWEKIFSTYPQIQKELVKAVTEDNFLPEYFREQKDRPLRANQQTAIYFHNGKI
jgi:hypothetical protein